MFFSKYPRKLKDTNLSIDNLFEISFDIANTLTHLHQNEILHGNIRLENIFLDDNNQCYLANFHLNKHPQGGISGDIYGFGQLGKYLYEHIVGNNNNISEEDSRNIDEFKNLFTKCLSSDVKKRPKAGLIIKELKEIRKNL